MFRRIFLLGVLLMVPLAAQAEFSPSQPIIHAREISPGMKGYMLTVLRGLEPSRIPVQVIDVIPQKPAISYGELLLLKLLGGHKLAEGMSGSPVYISGKLAGAIRSGWKEADHTIAIAMPIEYMLTLGTDTRAGCLLSCEIPASLVTVSGLSARTPAMSELSRKLGLSFTQGISSGGGSTIQPGPEAIKPGSSISSVLVWGDVEVASLGTVTATDNHGRFLAFGHDFMKRGKVAYPSAGAYVHQVVGSSSFPFKLASVRGINGTITHDGETGIAGVLGQYPQSISCELVFRDNDRDIERTSKFRVVADEYIAPKLIEAVFSGLAEEIWGRKGQGTMAVNIRIDGRNIPSTWARKDMFFSDGNILDAAFKQVKEVIGAYLSQPFSETMPTGFTVTVDATTLPKVLMIEDVTAPEDARPGDEVEVSVKLRAWREEPITRKFRLTIPNDTGGTVELIVRGGGTQSFGQAGIEGGWKSITSLERMLTEFRAADANNQLILELNADRTGDFLQKLAASRKKGAKISVKKGRNSDLLPEEEEYLSETKERRIKEGTLKIYDTEYCVEGLMRRVIHTEK